jgi:XRE family transcriptional regulator, aerobic/anaerobic benzoate catabolism transcriptional regulator
VAQQRSHKRVAEPPGTAAGVEVGDAKFLADLGQRVRQSRERRGMARRVLARDANVSERYLAQLEAGAGNISIVLLRRVASALGLSLGEVLNEGSRGADYQLLQRLFARLPENRIEETVFRLLRELGAGESARRQRIALIGLRGAGKSTLGLLLASKLQIPFVEIDREIEQEAGIPLSEIFSLYGQGGYRRFERKCLERLIKMHERTVISAGGGIVSEVETYGLLRSHCYTVWLKATPEEHMARVAAQGDFRPMQASAEAMEDLRQILSAREPLYAKADATVETSGLTPEECLRKLHRAVSDTAHPSGG